MTNGEFNSLRTQGYQRPISVLQIKANARMKYSRKGESTLLAMLTPISKCSGTSIVKTFGEKFNICLVGRTRMSDLISQNSQRLIILLCYYSNRFLIWHLSCHVAILMVGHLALLLGRCQTAGYTMQAHALTYMFSMK